MKYKLYNLDFSGASYKANDDGTIIATGIIVLSCVDGAYADKFLQRDYLPETIIPGTVPTAQIQQFLIDAGAQFVKNTYPNTI